MNSSKKISWWYFKVFETCFRCCRRYSGDLKKIIFYLNIDKVASITWFQTHYWKFDAWSLFSGSFLCHLYLLRYVSQIVVVVVLTQSKEVRIHTFSMFILASVHVTSHTTTNHRIYLYGSRSCDSSLTGDFILTWMLNCWFRILVWLALLIWLISYIDSGTNLCVKPRKNV